MAVPWARRPGHAGGAAFSLGRCTPALPGGGGARLRGPCCCTARAGFDSSAQVRRLASRMVARARAPPPPRRLARWLPPAGPRSRPRPWPAAAGHTEPVCLQPARDAAPSLAWTRAGCRLPRPPTVQTSTFFGRSLWCQTSHTVCPADRGLHTSTSTRIRSTCGGGRFACGAPRRMQVLSTAGTNARAAACTLNLSGAMA